MFATTDPVEMDTFRARAKVRNRIPGLVVEVLDPRDARSILPALGPEVIGGYIARADGIVDVLRLFSALSAAARRAGAIILRETAVTGIDVGGGRVRGVLTSRGPIAAPTVVNAAGVYVPHVGRMAGVTIPVDAEHGHMAVTHRPRRCCRFRRSTSRSGQTARSRLAQATRLPGTATRLVPSGCLPSSITQSGWCLRDRSTECGPHPVPFEPI